MAVGLPHPAILYGLLPLSHSPVNLGVKQGSRYMSTKTHTNFINNKKVKIVDPYPVNPISHKLLFSPKYLGSLYSLISEKVLSMLNPQSTKNALIPINEVIDLAKDPSGVQRKYGNKAIIYLWTHKETGRQYVGSTINAKNRFGRSYNSISGLSSSPFNKALALYGHGAFYVTILAVLPPYKYIIWPLETLWRMILTPYFNKSLISGTTVGNKLTIGLEDVKIAEPYGNGTELLGAEDVMEKERVNNLGNKLGKSLTGELNPFYGKTHSLETKLFMSAAKGKVIYVYLVNADGTLSFFNEYVSANLAYLSLGISRPTILKYARSESTYKKDNKTYFFSLRRLI